MRFVFLVLLGSLLTACTNESGTTTSTIGTTTTTDPTTTTSETPPTTSARSRCEEATQEVIETMDTILDRVDADPQGFVDDPGATVADIASEMGSLVGQECGLEYSGEALSELLVYLADETSNRSIFAQTAIEGILESICTNPPVELTLRGRAACATSQ